MFNLVDEIVLFFRIRAAARRERRNPSGLAGLAAALDEALEKFPNDAVSQQAKARSELALRELFGIRKWDA